MRLGVRCDLCSLVVGSVNQLADMTRPPVINHTLLSLSLSAVWCGLGQLTKHWAWGAGGCCGGDSVGFFSSMFGHRTVVVCRRRD